jgi:hypothetical protein
MKDEPESTQIIKTIESSLEGITKENGFYTDLGKSVHRGFLAHAINGGKAKFPLIAIEPEEEGPDTPSKPNQILESVELIAVVDSLVFPSDELRRCLKDIRKTILQMNKQDWDQRYSGASDKPVWIKGELLLGRAKFRMDQSGKYSLAILPLSYIFFEKYGE